MSCNVVEMRIDHEVYLFGNEEDAKAASAAMLRGAKIYSPANHSDREGKMGIMPIETHVRRVCVGVSERKAVQALPKGRGKGEVRCARNQRTTFESSNFRDLCCYACGMKILFPKDGSLTVDQAQKIAEDSGWWVGKYNCFCPTCTANSDVLIEGGISRSRNRQKIMNHETCKKEETHA